MTNPTEEDLRYRLKIAERNLAMAVKTLQGIRAIPVGQDEFLNQSDLSFCVMSAGHTLEHIFPEKKENL